MYVVRFKLEKISTAREKEIIESLVKSKSTILVLSCIGNWDIFVEFYARDNKEYGSLLDTFMAIIGENLAEYSVAAALELISEPHAYLFKEKGKKIEIQSIARSKETVKFDEEDKKILQILNTDARIPSSEVAQKIGVSLDTVIYRIKRMIKQGIVESFRPSLNISLLGYDWYIVNLWLEPSGDKRRKALISFLRDNDAIFFICRLAEPNRLQFELMAKSAKEFRQIFMEIREHFGDIIKQHEALLVFEEYKFTYVPESVVLMK